MVSNNGLASIARSSLVSWRFVVGLYTSSVSFQVTRERPLLGRPLRSLFLLSICVRFFLFTSLRRALLPSLLPLPSSFCICDQSSMSITSTPLTQPLFLFRQQPLHHPFQPPDCVFADLIVNHQASTPSFNPFFRCHFRHLVCTGATVSDIQPHHIRLNGMRQLPSLLHPKLFNLPRSLVACSQPAPLARWSRPEVLVHGNARRGGNDACLPGPAADGLANPPAVRDEGCVADDYATDRGAQPLAEAEAHAVEFAAEIGEGACVGGDDFPDPRAVQVHFYVIRAGECGDALDLVEGHNHSVEGILEGYDAGGAGVDVV